MHPGGSCYFFFFTDAATTEIYTLSLHDALPICGGTCRIVGVVQLRMGEHFAQRHRWRSTRLSDMEIEEHTSELQSQFHLVCRLLLEKKNPSATSSETPTTPPPPTHPRSGIPSRV